MWFLGIDIGTTHIKVVGLTESGDVMPAGKRRTPTLNIGGLVHHDAAQIWDATVDLITQYAHETSADHGGLAAVSIGSFGQEESVALDSAGRVVRPSLGWWQILPEPALGPETSEYLDSFDHYRISGFRYRPIQTPEQIARMRRDHPADWARVSHWDDFATYASWRLTGQRAADSSQLTHSQFFDFQSLTPHRESLAALDVDAELFAPICHTGSRIGEIADGILPEVSLEPGAVVVMGGHDQVLAAYAVSRDHAVSAFDSIGTSEYVMIVGSQPQPEMDGYRRGVDIEPAWRPDEYLLGCALPSGKTLHLVAELFFAGDFERLFAALGPDIEAGNQPQVSVSAMRPGEEGLLWLEGIPPEADAVTVARRCADTLSDTAADAMRLMRRLSGGGDGEIALMGSLFQRPEMVAHRRRRWNESLVVTDIAEPVATGAARVARDSVVGAS